MAFKFDITRVIRKPGSAGSDGVTTASSDNSPAPSPINENGPTSSDRDDKHGAVRLSARWSRNWSWRSAKKSITSEKSVRADGHSVRDNQTKYRSNTHSTVRSSATATDDEEDNEYEQRRQREALNTFTIKFGRTSPRRYSDDYKISPCNSRLAIFEQDEP